MIITAKITGITYKPFLINNCAEFSFTDFDINTIPSYCMIKNNGVSVSISKWVSPKRTRSYPYERVYNTLNGSRKITVIPIIKDEGLEGDRDFIQWDTISLMSLLDVYVILGYYENAERHRSKGNKITNQKMNNEYIKAKISEISNYHSSPLHWNLQEIKQALPGLIVNVLDSYNRISKNLNIAFHNVKGIEKFQDQILAGANNFMLTSRLKAKGAQSREYQTIQQKEVLTTLTKAKINISNYLGGLYYFTTDEIEIRDNFIYLIEAKHSKNAKLPSISDIKDGLLKMILYSNLEELSVDSKVYKSVPVLKLTSSKLTGSVTSDNSDEELVNFMSYNVFNDRLIKLTELIYQECRENNIVLRIERG
ncbi:MAG: hypothetical protein K9J13_16955 [Saprospiraceae bacterium]|nr:hypothetical protein [Saprospiraceae bacterium]